MTPPMFPPTAFASMHRRRILLGLSAWLGLALVAGLDAKDDKDALDEIPELISRDGGGSRWKDTKELKALAAKGDPQACFALGTRMVFGDEEIPVDLPKAHALLTTAAAGGVADAHFRLGKLYHDGAGVTRDYAKALEHYTAAARQGVPEAQHNIGSMLVSARGVKRNYVEGLAWLLVAEKHGAGSDAVELVRQRLAKRPADIRAAEARAAEIASDLPHAWVARDEAPAPVGPPKASPPPTVAPKIEPPVVTPAIPPPTIDLVPPPNLAIPIEPPPPPPTSSGSGS